MINGVPLLFDVEGWDGILRLLLTLEGTSNVLSPFLASSEGG